MPPGGVDNRCSTMNSTRWMRKKPLRVSIRIKRKKKNETKIPIFFGSSFNLYSRAILFHGPLHTLAFVQDQYSSRKKKKKIKNNRNKKIIKKKKFVVNN